jgi:hypothetical protein
VFVSVIYTHPKANSTRAATEIAEVIRSLQFASPDAPNFILGDFNHCDLRTALPSFKQYVTVKTRSGSILDRCYGNIPKAYKSFSLPNIGQSDHETVHLVPAYKPVVQTNPVVKKIVKVWSDDNVQQLQGCYECTDWDMFIESSNSVDEATDVISSYITFCEDTIIEKKEVKIFPNNKPWISKSLKRTINEKKVAFQSGNKEERKKVQRKLREEIKKAKLEYKDKVEQQFQSGSMRDAWQGLKNLTGQNRPHSTATGLPEEDRRTFANSLNEFYCRFERTDMTDKLSSVISDLKSKEEVEDGSADVDFEIDGSTVEDLFKRLNTRKAVGPDHIGGKLLRFCSAQLSYVFGLLFSWSLRENTVPTLWKTSVICPIPKSRNPSELNDYRPVALTSIVMKCFERIVLRKLLTQTQHALDPLQFAYKHNRSTDDATFTILNNTYTHLEKPNSFVRILFVDFSSAFNTIQPHLMALKLSGLGVHPKLILWIVSFLVDRLQSVCYDRMLSDSRSTSTGSPQGTVLSPVLFTLYTNDCVGTETTPLIKFSDDTALQDLSNSDSAYLQEVDKFTAWCKENYLDLNVKKTKEMVIDFRRNPDSVPVLFIDGTKVERVGEYKYLGTIIDSKLTFTPNTNAIHKKCQPRLYCLQKLRSLNVNHSVLCAFYRCFLESVLTFGLMCWFGGLCVKNRNVLDRVVKVCGKIVGEKQKSLTELYESRVVRKAKSILSDETHVLAKHFELLPSGKRFRVPKLSTVRSKSSFIPRSIDLLNKKCK